MNKGGRPKKTRAEKERAGTLQKCREAKNPLSFEPLSSVPDPPSWLGKDGSKFFRHYGGILLGQKLLTAGDIGEFEKASMAYDMLMIHWNKMKEDQGVYKTQNNYTQKTASWQIW